MGRVRTAQGAAQRSPLPGYPKPPEPEIATWPASRRRATWFLDAQKVTESYVLDALDVDDANDEATRH